VDSLLPFDGDANKIRLVWEILDNGFRRDRFTAQQIGWIAKRGWLSGHKDSLVSDFLARIGQELFHSLFPKGSTVAQLFQRTIGRSEENHEPLILQIAIDAGSARLFTYPWELLNDGRDYLIHNHVSISRYISFDSPPSALKLREQLNVLLICSKATDESNQLYAIPHDERKAIRRAFRKAERAGNIRVSQLRTASVKALRRFFRACTSQTSPDIIHFDGHGAFARRCSNRSDTDTPCNTVNWQRQGRKCIRCGSSLPPPEGLFLFESSSGDPEYVSARALADLVNPPGAPDCLPGLVVLSSCQSGVTGGCTTAFNGAAQSLIRVGVPAVVAMQQVVTVEAASSFAEGFYWSLVRRNPLHLAMQEGRRAIGIDTDQWYRPVLYRRWTGNESGHMFASSGHAINSLVDVEHAKERAVYVAKLIYEQFQHETGGIASGMSEYANHDRPGEWTTAECIYVGMRCWALAKAGPNPLAIRRATLWMLEGQSRRNSGGWGDIGYDIGSDQPTNVPCVDSTAWMVLALTELLKRNELIALPKAKLLTALQHAILFLIDSQTLDGGWGTFRDDELGARTYPTAMAIFSLANTIPEAPHMKDVGARIRPALRRGLLWAARQSRTHGWSANPRENDSNAASTAHMYFALAQAALNGLEDRLSGPRIVHAVPRFLDEIAKNQNRIANHVESLPWRRLGPVRQFEWKWQPWLFPLAQMFSHSPILQHCSLEMREAFLRRLDAHGPWKLALGCFSLCVYASVGRFPETIPPRP
jgi:CHAT domain